MKAQEKAHAQHHAGYRTYFTVAGILFVVTLIEFLIVFLKGVPGLVSTVLLALSATKFALVAAIFMHLKFDNKLLSWFFAGGVALAAAITIALKAIAWA